MAEVGRPSEMTEEKVKKLEEAFALDASVGEACFYADISKQTYYNWLEKNPELVERFEALREKPILLARQTVVKSIASDPDIALKYLERKRRKEFATRQEMTGQEGEPLALTMVINAPKPEDDIQSNEEAVPSVAIDLEPAKD